MAATRVEAQQNDSKYEKVHGDQPQDIVFHNSRDSTRGVIFCDSKTLSKSKTFGQHSVETDMSQYRSESGTVVSAHNSSSEEQGNSSSENNKKSRDGKLLKLNSESNVPIDQNSVKVSESGHSMQLYNMGLSSRTHYHSDQRGVAGHSSSSIESSGLAHNPFSHLRPPNRHSLHTSNAPSVSSRPVNTVSSFSPGGSVSNMQSKLFSGQSISQQTGPTPTLNQLLQSSHPLQRHQNAYSELSVPKTSDQSVSGMGSYHPMWSPHQTSVSCNPHSISYRGQAQIQQFFTDIGLKNI